MVRMADRAENAATDFNAIRISIASPEQILSWSHGEVTKPETINYRTLRPEKDGLFCERLFGPTKDWECFCGKYKRIRYRGVVCDRCGVEVTRAKVRRERMGHIRLAAPVAHIWFSKTNPSRLGLLLDLSPRNLERVLYFAQHIVISVDEDARREAIEAVQLRHELEVERRRANASDDLEELNRTLLILTGGIEPETDDPAVEFAPEGGEPVAELKEVQQQIDEINNRLAADEADLDYNLKITLEELNDIRKMQLLSESRLRELQERYPRDRDTGLAIFETGMGAEAILAILRAVDLEALRDQLINDMHSTSGQRRQKAIKRLRVVEAFRQSGHRADGGHGEGTRVEDMIFTVMPVLPPELRPMVQLDGGRFATSDLNDLYRRVINRNNRLKRLMTLGAPEIIIRNEKRMLQEAVDALIDNGRRGRPIQGSHNHKLKSLSDLLRGKQGRFRQNLLGKRVDYSGRSVIVVGPELKMNECGLPRRMALELFKPFVMHRLVMLGIAPNIKSAKRMVERARGDVWDILEDVIKNRPVLLNRAPTLHRLGIQAFMPVLIDGHAIQIHPLVCSAFNADFDGDQMAVHVPLSQMAVLEAREEMISTNNMLSPASGDPLVAPALDILIGNFYQTELKREDTGAYRRFSDIDEAMAAYNQGELTLHAPIYVRHTKGSSDQWRETSLGRLIFSEKLPDSISFRNERLSRQELNELVLELHQNLTNEEMAEVLDSIKGLGYQYATEYTTSFSFSDIPGLPEKPQILAEAQESIYQYQEEFNLGLITKEERHVKTIDAWTQASYRVLELVRKNIVDYEARYGSLGTGGGQLRDYQALGYGALDVMLESGAKGNTSQINQTVGMRGLVQRAGSSSEVLSGVGSGVMELPIKSSLREGLTPLEYFISTYGARKGLTDTALNTASSGYLTRRLVDVAQEVIIQGEDCGALEGWVPRRPPEHSRITLQDRVAGRIAAEAIAHPETGEVLVHRNENITWQKAERLVDSGVIEIMVRSPLTCEAPRGVCRMCYGDLAANGRPVLEGQAVGIIAAQSIGEPGTQLTMRVFHEGGVRRTNSSLDEAVLSIARELQPIPVKMRREVGVLRREIERDAFLAFLQFLKANQDALESLCKEMSAKAILLLERKFTDELSKLLCKELSALMKCKELSALMKKEEIVRLRKELESFYSRWAREQQPLDTLTHDIHDELSKLLCEELSAEELSALMKKEEIVRLRKELESFYSRRIREQQTWDTLTHDIHDELSKLLCEVRSAAPDAALEERINKITDSVRQNVQKFKILITETTTDDKLLEQLLSALIEILKLIARGLQPAMDMSATTTRLREMLEGLRGFDSSWVREDIARLRETNNYRDAQSLASHIHSELSGIPEDSSSIRSLSGDLRGMVKLVPSGLAKIGAHELQRHEARIGEISSSVAQDLQQVKTRITGAIANIPGADERLQGRLLLTLDRILEDLTHFSETGRLKAITGRIADARGDDDNYAVAVAFNRIHEDMLRHSDDLEKEADVIRQDVEVQNLDITGGLPQVEGIFEARVPKDAAILSDIDGEVELEDEEEGNILRENRILRVVYREEIREDHPLPEGAQIRVEDGDLVEEGDALAVVPQVERFSLPEGAEALVDDGEEVTEGMVLASLPEGAESESAIAPTATASGRVELAGGELTIVSEGATVEAAVSGRVELADGHITVIGEDLETREHDIPTSTYLLMVRNGDKVNAGAPLTSGPMNPHDILRIRGKEALQSYIVDQVQAVYQSQGVTIQDKHIEIILRQMLRRVQVTQPGDTDLIPGEVVDKFAFQEQVAKVLAEGGEPATAEQVLLGITRASLRTDSFLSAASFQETTRVLTEAAVKGQQDYLLGLKENVIIGRLIPAQVDIPGMEELLRPQPALNMSAITPGGWLQGNAGKGEEDQEGKATFGPEDGFERLAQAARRYAEEGEDDFDDDFFDDDDDDLDEADDTVTSAADSAEDQPS